MASLHEELTASASGCKLCAYLATLSSSEATLWRGELALPETRNVNVVRALARRDVDLNEASVRRHRKNHGGV